MRADSAAARRLAVNVPRQESSPEILDIAAAEQLAGNWQLNLIDAEEWNEADGRESLVAGGWLSRGIWDTLLWTVFVLVLAEPLIANRIFWFRRSAAERRARRTA